MKPFECTGVRVAAFSVEDSQEPSLSASDSVPMGRARKDFCNQMAASKWDWVLLAALIGLFAGIEYAVKPNKWYMAPQDYETVMYPFVEDTVPSWSVPIIALIPMVLVLVAAIFPRMLGSLKTRELHDLVYAILISIAITGSVTSLLKVAVGRPRPDFLERYAVE